MEIYVSTDVETDGPIPGVYSMLSIGSAAYLPDKTFLSGFTANLETLTGAEQHPETMRWWQGQPEAWAACRQKLQPPEEVMRNYLTWLKALPGDPVFVAYPAAFDFMYVCWYLNRFTGENPFGWHALDIKTFAMALTGATSSTPSSATCPANGSTTSPTPTRPSTTPSPRARSSATCSRSTSGG